MERTFVRVSEAADELGVTATTLRRRFRALGLPAFRDPHDLRRRLVRRADLLAAFGPPLPLTGPPGLAPPHPQETDAPSPHDR
jgi:hypothetical protein